MSWPKKAKWQKCSGCNQDAPALVTTTPSGRKVIVINCPRCDRPKGELRDPRT